MSKSIQLAQLVAMMRYELKIIWRGRTLIVLLLALLALCVINALVVSSTSAAISPDGGTAGAALMVVFMAWSPLGITLALLVPIMFADTIPKDTQLGIRELLDSLPVSPGTYLSGKLAGVWLALLVGTSVVMVITGIIWRIALGAYDVGPYLNMMIFGAWALILINTGLGVLLTAGQPGRRRAVGLLLLLFIIIPVFTSTGSMSAPTEPIWMLSPIRPTILSYFLHLDITAVQLLTAIGVGLIELCIVWLIMREWLKWHNQQT
jgi:hypothetical protein